MRILPTASLLLVFASHDAFAGIRHTVALAVDTNSLAEKVATEVQEDIGPQVLAGIADIMSTPDPTKIDLTAVSEVKTLARILECEGAECLQDLGQDTGVDLLIKVKVRAKQAAQEASNEAAKKVSKRASKKAAKTTKADYLVSMIVVRAAPSREVWSEKTDCLACEASEIKRTASLLGSALAERIKPKLATTPKPIAEAATQAPEPVPTPPPPPEPPVAVDTSPSPAAPAPAWYVPRYLSVTALAGGVLLLGSGIYLVHINEKGTCDLAASQDLCAKRYKTQNLGFGLIAGGGLATLGGLAGLLFFPPGTSSTHMALNFTGSSFSLSGNF